MFLNDVYKSKITIYKTEYNDYLQILFICGRGWRAGVRRGNFRGAEDSGAGDRRGDLRTAGGSGVRNGRGAGNTLAGGLVSGAVH